MYKVIGTKKNRSFRVIWGLEEMALDYEIIDAPPRSDAAKGHNASGKVPSLVVGDETINDSVAILQFLADRHEMLTFKPGTVERARQDSFMQFACDEMDGALWAAARHSFILPEEKRVPEIKEPLRWEFARSMKVLADRLGDNEYLMGEQFTIADIVVSHCGRWARNAKFDYDQPSVDAYLDRCFARPAYARAAET